AFFVRPSRETRRTKPRLKAGVNLTQPQKFISRNDVTIELSVLRPSRPWGGTRPRLKTDVKKMLLLTLRLLIE
ncbi:MAG: hypothetical protein ABIK27_07680, partial [Bacteroidota bacterium]